MKRRSKAASCSARAAKAEAALAEIVQLIAEDKFEPNYLIGMINDIARHGPRQGC